MRLLKRLFVAIFVFGLVFSTTQVYFAKIENDSKVRLYGEEAAAENIKQKVDNELLFLLAGVDRNADGTVGDFSRSDTLMLVKANANTGKIDILSIPRDSRVPIKGEFDKINHAHAYGGIELTMQTIRNFLGIDLDYYVQVDFEAVQKIVDALGGFDYDVPSGVYVQRGESVNIEPGSQHLDGINTLWYLRTRYIYQNGDIGRVNAQQKFIKDTVDQIVEKFSAMNIPSFINTYLKDVKTNIPLSTILKMSSNIKKFSSSKVNTYAVTGFEQTINGTSYYIPDYNKAWQIRDKIFKDYIWDKWDKEESGYLEYQNYFDNQDDLSNDTDKNQNIDYNYDNKEGGYYNQQNSYNN
ncbi:MAG: LCP family protein, partial [Tissierellia bacterium]|nr:LCP family protein [Tissierellia bacterium]